MTNLVIAIIGVLLVAALVRGLLAVYAPRAYAALEAADAQIREGRNALIRLGVATVARLFRRRP